MRVEIVKTMMRLPLLFLALACAMAPALVRDVAGAVALLGVLFALASAWRRLRCVDQRADRHATAGQAGLL